MILQLLLSEKDVGLRCKKWQNLGCISFRCRLDVITARNARYLTGNNKTLQGNFDPTRLYSPPSEIKKMVKQMINEFGKG